jgi:hypothetical protein
VLIVEVDVVNGGVYSVRVRATLKEKGRWLIDRLTSSPWVRSRTRGITGVSSITSLTSSEEWAYSVAQLGSILDRDRVDF